MGSSTSQALRCIADLLDTMPDLPDYVVTVYSHEPRVSLLFGAGPDDDLRREAVRRVLNALGSTPMSDNVEYGGSASLGSYTLDVSTGYD